MAASTVWLTFYRVSPKRGSLLENVADIVAHDHWKPYYALKGVSHALRNAHHLRELQALIETEKKDWARKMQRLLRRGSAMRCDAAILPIHGEIGLFGHIVPDRRGAEEVSENLFPMSPRTLEAWPLPLRCSGRAGRRDFAPSLSQNDA